MHDNGSSSHKKPSITDSKNNLHISAEETTVRKNPVMTMLAEKTSATSEKRATSTGNFGVDQYERFILDSDEMEFKGKSKMPSTARLIKIQHLVNLT